MAAKYRKVDPRFWRDEAVRLLTVEEKAIALYIVTGQSNRIGLFYFSLAMACEDLGIAYQHDTLCDRVSDTVSGSFREPFRKVFSTLKWEWDEATNVVYLPTWFKYNEPMNPKHLAGSLSDLPDIPKSDLANKFAENKQFIPEAMHARFDAVCKRYGIPYGIPSGYQKQKQKQKQKQDSAEALKHPETENHPEEPNDLTNDSLAQEWVHFSTAHVNARKRDDLKGMVPQIAELARLGVPRELILSEIRREDRNRSEWFGDFEKRLRKTNPASVSPEKVEREREEIRIAMNGGKA